MDFEGLSRNLARLKTDFLCKSEMMKSGLFIDTTSSHIYSTVEGLRTGEQVELWTSLPVGFHSHIGFSG